MLRQPCAGARGMVGILAGAFLCASSASGAMISLSTHSSDETSPSVLLASFDFQVAGSTLTLTVDNLTSGDDAYHLNQIFFNAGPSVSGLSLVTPGDGWSLQTDSKVGRFGEFDFGLIGGVGADPDMVAPGGSLIFTFDIAGVAIDADFTTFESSNPPGDLPSIVAAKFIRGPGDDSAFGAFSNMPTPGALAAFGLAGVAALGRRRRA